MISARNFLPPQFAHQAEQVSMHIDDIRNVVYGARQALSHLCADELRYVTASISRMEAALYAMSRPTGQQAAHLGEDHAR